MNKLTVLAALVSVATLAFSADNQWDGDSLGYNGAFGTTNGLPADWSTATEIYTIDPDNPNDFGYLSVQNLANTTVIVTNSFNGLIEFKNGPGAYTNTVVSVDEGVVVTGAVPGTGLNSGKRALSVEVDALPFGKYGALILEEGTYVGGASSQGAYVSGLSLVEVNGSKISGGKGTSVASDGSGTASLGGDGILCNNVDLLVIDGRQVEADTISGGDGGDNLYNNSSVLVSAKGGNAVSMFLFNSATVMENGRVVGGSGGTLVSTASSYFDLSGGRGFNFFSGTLTLNDGIVIGGSGGTATVKSVTGTSLARGGAAVFLSGSTVGNAQFGSVEITGGSGGDVVSSGTANSLNISGGNGITVTNTAVSIVANGATVTGGAGGTLESSGSSGVVAKGGDGLVYYGKGAGVSGTATIIGGSYTGGAGGTIDDDTGTGNVSAGRGAYFNNGLTVAIGGDAVFTGGAAGTLNGVTGVQGVALEIRDATVTITNGTFIGSKGLLTSTVGGNNSVTIMGGSFGDVKFGGNDTVDISGGTFDEMLLSGSGAKDLTINGEDDDLSIGSLNFGATGTASVSATEAGLTSIVVSSGLNNTLDVFDNGAAISTIEQTGGAIDVSFNGTQVIDDITISSGSMDIFGTDLAVNDGKLYQLVDSDASLNVDQKLTVRKGGTLDVGLGTVTATDFVASQGANIKTTFSEDGLGGIDTGVITGDNVTIGDVNWTLVNDGSVTDSSLFEDGFLLASGSTLNYGSLSALKFSITDNPEWMDGINGLSTNMSGGLINLYATYGTLSLIKVLEDEDYDDLDLVVEDLQRYIDANPELGQFVKTNWTSAAEFSEGATSTYRRAPEMANAMISLQSVFADQIKDRTRSYLRLQDWGTPSTVAPMGAQGPAEWYEDSVMWTRDHLPFWDVKKAARSAADNAPMPNIKGEPSDTVGKPYMASSTQKGDDYDAFVDKVHGMLPNVDTKIEVPTTYQVWGRGYVSDLDQQATGSTAGSDYFAGYDARGFGGIMGIDKRLENMMFGIGGGYARTDVDGDSGLDGTADTVHAVGYFSAMLNQFYMDANINYSFSDVEVTGVDSFGYEGDYKANMLGMYLGGGYGMAAFSDKLLFTPEASFLLTYYGHGSYTETSSVGMPEKSFDSYDHWSQLLSLGATLSMVKQIESFRTELEFQPEVRAHWLHEFNADMEDETYVLDGGVNALSAAIQAREEDLIKIGTGIRFSKWDNDTTEFGIDLDGVFGRDYDAYIISGKLMHRF
ncbi:hypothetical protein [Pontiella sp.]|uniref:hypothetical protein n=1 Tax=Pontiella sp. TaxID=2837462 RepID=UPI003562D10C